MTDPDPDPDVFEGIVCTVHPNLWANDFIGDDIFIDDDTVES